MNSELAERLRLYATGKLKPGEDPSAIYRAMSEAARVLLDETRRQYHPPVGHGHFRVPLTEIEPVAKTIIHKDYHTSLFVTLPAAKQLGAGIHSLYATPAIDGQLIAAFTQAREKLVMAALSQETTGKRETYGDGFSQGIWHAVEAIDAVLSTPPTTEREARE